MQREHLETVAQLLDVAGDGRDEEAWGLRFREHLGAAMKLHGERLSSLGATPPALRRQAEVLRARLELHEIVAERLESRAARLDPGLAEAMRALRATSGSLVLEAMALADMAEVKESPRGSASSQAHAVAAADASGHAKPKVEVTLSCFELLQLIQDVYTSKAQADAEAASEPETLESYFYAQLAVRCSEEQGASAAAVDQAACAVFAAIEQHASSHWEVAAFAKILQHSIPEGFAAAAELQRESLHKLVRSTLDEALQHNPPEERDALWQAWQRSGIPVAACERAISHMYSIQDSQQLLARVRGLANARGGASSSSAVKLSELEQCVVFYQLWLTETFLDGFVELFRSLDHEACGVLDAANILELERRLAERGELQAAAAEVLELHSGCSATFSQCAAMVAPPGCTVADQWIGAKA